MAPSSRIDESLWKEHRQMICQLYIDQDVPLPQLVDEMSHQCNFTASSSQYKAKFKAWRVGKNTKGHVWKGLSRALRRRNLAISQVDVFVDKKPISHEKLKRELPRYDLPTFASSGPPKLCLSQRALQRPVRSPTPDGIFIREKFQLPRPLTIALPWHDICAKIEQMMSASSTRECNRSTSPTPPIALEVADDLVDWEYGQNCDDVTLSSSLFEWDRIRPGNTSLGVTGVVTDYHIPQDNDILGANIVGVFGLPGWLCHSEIVPEMMKLVTPYAPERFPGETETAVHEILDSRSTTRMQVLTSYMALMLANDLLKDTQVDSFTVFLNEVAGDKAFELLAMSQTPSSRAIMSKFAFAAIRMDLPRLLRSALRNNMDVNCRSTGFWSKTLLYYAIEFQRVEIVQLLMEAGADAGALPLSGENHHVNPCPLSYRAIHCSSADYYEMADFYCQCEVHRMLRGSALSRAVSSKVVNEVVPLLLQKGASVHAHPVVIEAIRHGARKRTIEMLLKAGASANECRKSLPFPFPEEQAGLVAVSRQSTALSAAITFGDESTARLLLDHGASPKGFVTNKYKKIVKDWMSYFYKSPLVVAAESGNLKMVKMLLEHGADANESPLDLFAGAEKRQLIRDLHAHVKGYTSRKSQMLILYPLQAAASLEAPSVAETLLASGANINPLYGTPPLTIAAIHERREIVKLLLKRGAMVNATNGEEFAMSAVEGAAISGNLNIFMLLIAAGAKLDWSSCTSKRKAPLQTIVQMGSRSILEYLLLHGPAFNLLSAPEYGIVMLQRFVEWQDYDSALELLQAGVTPNGLCRDGKSPLTAAIMNEDLRLISLLLAWRADVNENATVEDMPSDIVMELDRIHPSFETPRVSFSPLQWVALTGNVQAATLLYIEGTEAGGQERSEHDVFHTDCALSLRLAVLFRREAMIKYLLNRGANPNAKLGDSKYPIQLSIENSDLEATKALLLHGADLHPDSYHSFFPLDTACECGDVDIVRLLITFSADTAVGFPLTYVFRGRFLREALIEERTEIMTLLLSRGLDVNHRHPYIDTPLQAAIRFSAPDQVAIQWACKLIENDADINGAPSSSGGRTALQAAVEMGNVEIVQYLLSKGADVNAAAAPLSGVTALQAAAINGYLRIAQILLEHGADIDADPSPFRGRRAIDGAAEWGRIDMVKFLLDNYDGPKTISELCESAMEYAKKENQWYVMELLRTYKRPSG